MDDKSSINITVTDLENILVLIDLATQRGALRANELSGVGALYEKVATVVKEIKAKQAANADKES